MEKLIRRMFSFLLAFSLCISLPGITAFAEADAADQETAESYQQEGKEILPGATDSAETEISESEAEEQTEASVK